MINTLTMPLERLLADPEIAQRGDRFLARDVGMSHMTVWRTRARLAEEARLQAEIAAMPATATAPKAREQEQLAAYLAVPVQALKALSEQSSGGYGGMRGATTPALIKTLARDAALHDRSPRQRDRARGPVQCLGGADAGDGRPRVRRAMQAFCMPHVVKVHSVPRLRLAGTSRRCF